MNFRQRQELDNHITGNYGEDQLFNERYLVKDNQEWHADHEAVCQDNDALDYGGPSVTWCASCGAVYHDGWDKPCASTVIGGTAK
jgi:hypothetical protein